MVKLTSLIVLAVVLVSAKAMNLPDSDPRPEDAMLFGIQDALIRSNGLALLAPVSRPCNF